MQLGYIGTGTMGNPMAKALIEAGHSVTVYDVRRESATNLCEMGANWADSPRELSEASEVVFTSLPGPVEAEKVLTDPDNGILAGIKTGGTWVDTTTNSPTTIHKLADICKQRGIEILDSPVSGRIPNMTMMVGGDPAVFEKHRAVLETMGKDVIYVGGTASGCTAKLVTQYLGYSNFIAGIEGMLIGAKAGLDMDILAKLIPISASASGVMARSIPLPPMGPWISSPRTCTWPVSLPVMCKPHPASATSWMMCCSVPKPRGSVRKGIPSWPGSWNRWPTRKSAPPKRNNQVPRPN